MFSIKRYRSEDRPVWDNFVKEARNATFLFMRDYMDYHADRFTDCSWMIWKGSRLVALLPANLTPDGTLHSHQGLTYGGWILPFGHINTTDLLDIFREAIAVWREMGITALDYKPLPSIYCATPSDDAEYALFRLGATLTEANVSSTLPLAASLPEASSLSLASSSLPEASSLSTAASLPEASSLSLSASLQRENCQIPHSESSCLRDCGANAVSAPSHYNKLRKRALAKASRLDFRIRETDSAAELLTLVADCLRDRHNAAPVHTAAELQRLKACFSEQIRFWLLDYDGAPQAAVCIYDTGRVAHAQYIASTPLARNLNLLTPLFHHLISNVYADRRYFDFGTSNEDHGRYLNDGLLRQKTSYGATALLHRRYLLSISTTAVTM
ncbi:MAG: GNAT family N-acetyltransferase [Bacteroides sp.]|nr:GNAT family N-acetyltransferase [Bacteroides sp.]